MRAVTAAPNACIWGISTKLNDRLTIGELVRILPGLYKEPPVDLEKIASSQERYMIFFPLKAAVRQKIVKKSGFYPAENFKKPRHMRTEHTVRGSFISWHIINTETWQRELVTNLSTEQKKLSPWGIWNDTLLLQRLVADWTLEKWC